MSEIPQQMQIRKAAIGDARQISYLIKKNTDRVLENNYTSEQIQVWKKENTVSAIKIKIEKRTIFCAFENERLLGTIGLEGTNVVGLYISYSQRGKGLGYQLLAFLEAYAIDNGIQELQLTPTPNGYGFYLKNGYSPFGEIDLYYEGVKFTETIMKKVLVR